MTTDVMSPQEQAEAFVTEQIAQERAKLQAALDSALNMEKEAAKEHKKLEDAYWKLAKRDLDGEPDEKEKEAREAADAALKTLQGISLAITGHREKLSRLDLDHSRRVREKREQLERGRNGNNNGKDKSMSKTATTRVPVPQSVIDRIVRETKTKSQQEVADALNKEGIKTASGKDWTPQNIWHAVKKATGKGVPRKAAKLNGAASGRHSGARKKTGTAKKRGTAKKTTAAKKSGAANPLSKSAQASGTSRGGTGSRKKKTAARRRS